jgi:Tfp pilus assembly protein PilF
MTHPADRQVQYLGVLRAAGAALALALVAGCTTVADEPVAAVAVAGMAADSTAGPDALVLAEQALDDGRLGDARVLLSRAVLATGETPRARLIAAELHLASGAYADAVKTFGALVQDSAVGPSALQGEGIALALAEGNAAAGEASLRAAVRQDPSLWRAWNTLGVHYDTLGDWRQAGISYNNALAVHPASAMILNNRGFSFLMQGRVAEAMADLSEAVRQDPSLAPAHENLRLALAWDGQYAQALAGAEDDVLGRALNNVGFVAMVRGDHDRAEAYLLQAIEADPAYNTVAARNLVTLRHMRQGSPKAASPLPQ